MEAFHTDDGSVAKFIHDDGSETAVKVVKSCSNFRDENGMVHTEWVDRNKFQAKTQFTHCALHFVRSKKIILHFFHLYFIFSY